ncbi:MAG TPA: hypothetical protein PLI43_03915 [Albidovulum sp.]|uniref:hypothetical protein n=1 Tax=Albidovulum sp. TaxID=1872424 RepID=UPI002B9D270E|nr:hypothetical protein [Albidovulum sp.]
MVTIKNIRELDNPRLRLPRSAQAIALFLMLAGMAQAETCLAPEPPFVPADSQALRDYDEIIRRDFELYFRDIQAYFRCLDTERARAFVEAKGVSEAYARFLGQAER